MAEKTQQMLKKSLNALITMDAGLARTVWGEDNEVDQLNSNIRKQAREQIARHPERSESLMSLASASQRVERIADLATNIAEDVVYMIEGEIIRHRYEESE
jgi:phosphate transport system protein